MVDEGDSLRGMDSGQGDERPPEWKNRSDVRHLLAGRVALERLRSDDFNGHDAVKK
jgi:hypothetical protein